MKYTTNSLIRNPLNNEFVEEGKTIELDETNFQVILLEATGSINKADEKYPDILDANGRPVKTKVDTSGERRQFVLSKNQIKKKK